jgi:signal transduction histidine kinase
MVYHPPGATEPLWVAVSAAPIRADGGKIIGAVSTMTDVTSLHEMQKEREMYVHTISHDLRIPLTVVLGHAELLGTTCRDADSGDHVEAILKGAERMQTMLDDLVDAARLEGGEIALAEEPLSLHGFLADLLQRASALPGASRIRVDLPAELPPVSADPPRLERILTNLLTNALKYSPPESAVEVKARAEGGEVVIAVRDRGQGIHPEDLPHLFKRFHRFRQPRKGDSVGLGLYITRSLVEAHGGRIWVESTPGEGSTFFFTLPAAGS